MKALILSAGQGSRLLPLTQDEPKCLLPVGDKSLIEIQIDALYESGVREVVVVTGFHAHKVDAALDAIQHTGRHPGLSIRTLFNPFYHVADNLGSCWMARSEMTKNCLILNGDTLFEPDALRHLLASPDAPITLAVDHKPEYDADDMKVQLEGNQVFAVSKTLAPDHVDGEAIGLLMLREDGAQQFTRALDEAIREPNGVKWWYLKVVDGLAARGQVWAASIQGATWGEVDTPADLDSVRKVFAQTKTLTAG